MPSSSQFPAPTSTFNAYKGKAGRSETWVKLSGLTKVPPHTHTHNDLIRHHSLPIEPQFFQPLPILVHTTAVAHTAPPLLLTACPISPPTSHILSVKVLIHCLLGKGNFITGGFITYRQGKHECDGAHTFLHGSDCQCKNSLFMRPLRLHRPLKIFSLAWLNL